MDKFQSMVHLLDRYGLELEASRTMHAMRAAQLSKQVDLLQVRVPPKLCNGGCLPTAQCNYVT